MFIDKNPIRKITNHIVNNYSDSPNAAAAIDDLVAKLKSFANMDEAIDILDSFKKSIKDVEYDPRYGTYRYLNYYIRPGLKSENTNYITNLQFINKLGHCKTSAPEIIHHGRSRDNQFDVIIYKVNDTKGGALRHLTSLSEIKPKQKEQFISEQINLLEDTGLYNSAVIDSFDDWYLTPDTNNIYIDSWNSLVKCFSAKQKEKVKEILKNKI